MSQKDEHKDFIAEFKLQSIELLNGTLSLPATSNVSITSFNFTINIESKADSLNKLIFMVVNIEIRSEDQIYLLGSLSVSCIYHVINYEKIVKVLSNGKLDLPKAFLDTLNSISVSTARGVMFSTFKGTFLHNAILPIINPAQFQNANAE
jgi:hypothetical protein